MNEQNVILSVLVISHNQADLIERCFESIIKQSIPFPYEIIISDDHSSDGTWDIIQAYAAKYPESKEKGGVYTPHVIATQMNSDDYHPANKSMRGGWNRSHACQFIHGKYFATIDADDYYRDGANNFAEQVAILEEHPECSACMENVLNLQIGDSLDKATLALPKELMEEGKIITAEEYIMKYHFINAAAFVFRQEGTSSLAQYGGRNVDATITAHFLQHGNIICHDSADYVYIQHVSSTSQQMLQSIDCYIFWGLGIYIPALIPSLKHWYMLSRIDEIQYAVSKCRHNYQLEPGSKKFLEGMNVYVYDAFNRKHTKIDDIRLHLSTWLISRMIKNHWKSRLCTTILYKLIIR